MNLNRAARVILVGTVLSSAWTAKTRAGFVFTNVADTTTAAPVSGSLTSVSVPSIDGGKVAFAGFYPGGSAVYVGTAGALTIISKAGNPAPVAIFNSYGNPIISGNTAVFRGTYNGFASTGVFTGSGGALTTVAKSGDAAPTGTFTSFDFGTSISGGVTAFSASYNSGANVGVFKSNGGVVTAIARSGDAAPNGTFSSFGNSQVSVSGNTVAFGGAYTNGSGVFTGSGGALTTIAKRGDTAPSGTFTSFDDPAISGSTAAFRGDYASVSGIFAGNGGPLLTIAKTGDAAPTGSFTAFGSASISGTTVALLGAYTGGTGIFLENGGPLQTVIKTGDSLFGSTVSNLSYGRSGLDADGSGKLAFLYFLSDGRTGVAIASQAAIPEAHQWLALTVVALGAIVVRVLRQKWCSISTTKFD